MIDIKYFDANVGPFDDSEYEYERSLWDDAHSAWVLAVNSIVDAQNNRKEEIVFVHSYPLVKNRIDVYVNK